MVWLGESACTDVELVGGKAASLGRLASSFRVPPGFCVTTRAHVAAGQPTGADGLPELPSQTSADVAGAYATLAQQVGKEAPSVAVRSSAADEDGAQSSFAGQHDTYLNVVGAGAIVRAVARCWASASTQRALEYRKHNGLAAGVRLGVLVQQLVPADVAAVVFSVNPITGSRDDVVINASWGLGESIVSGTVTPDTFVVSKSKLEVHESRIADKRRMTIPSDDGTREVDVPRFLRAQPSLDTACLCDAARLARGLEELMGCPVDVECCWKGGILYLLQCRPITTLQHL